MAHRRLAHVVSGPDASGNDHHGGEACAKQGDRMIEPGLEDG